MNCTPLCTQCPSSVPLQDEAKAKFAAAEGDLVTMLNVWRAWHEKGRDHRWCACSLLMG